MRNLLGGKGANLAEMASIGLPVPPGFTITTEVCTCYYEHGKQYPEELRGAGGGGAGPRRGGGRQALRRRGQAAAGLGALRRARLHAGHDGHGAEPRPQRRRRWRGWRRPRGDARFAWDSYRRFIQMYGSVVLGIDHHRFEEIIENVKLDARRDRGHRAHRRSDWHGVVDGYKEMVEEVRGEPFPQDPEDQLWGAIGAVFGSWMNPRANTYRRLHDIPADWGTAVNVQAMVFGNMGEDCATGVCFTRDPSHRRERLLRRVPDQRPGRGRGGRHPHAAADERGARQAGRAQHGARHARGLRRAGAGARDAGAALPRHAGHRVHGAAEQALHAADAQRQAHRRRAPEDRRGHGRARA